MHKRAVIVCNDQHGGQTRQRHTQGTPKAGTVQSFKLIQADNYSKSSRDAAAADLYSEATSNCLAPDQVPLIGLQLFLLSHTPLTLRGLVSGTQPACQLCSQAVGGTRSCTHKSGTLLAVQGI